MAFLFSCISESLSHLVSKGTAPLNQIVGEVEHGMTNGTILRLHFDNQAYQSETGSRLLPTSVFFEAFPFSLVFNRGLIIINAGQSLQRAFPTILGKRVDAVFKLARPLINLDWEGVSWLPML
ncbi:hypothetical protein X801_06839 [Opisthorchis viverrini]|uniref:guanylate cyclase n=1 Tax=Opisthorchis viverrini TaxID=6198 RepID=A0A1S8WSD9_OPIVI|nr:hypothetical protein X801_06839 [Opisthorchis viverrini]